MLSLQSEINFLKIIVTIAVLITPGKKKIYHNVALILKKRKKTMLWSVKFHSIPS